ncbi:class I SAM-dependent rRNA methyltransferase [bacterium]|nr:class I SAM-dependent rRNA methyltransferase [bacterium]
MLRRHPWVFSGAIEKIQGSPACGDLVLIESADGIYLGIGAYSPQSQIRCRVWAFEKTVINTQEELLEMVRVRIKNAISLRLTDPNLQDSKSFRAIHAESDLIPGLIVDVYQEIAVVQFLSCGVEKMRQEIAEMLREELNVNVIYERSDADVRTLEGLEPREGLLFGELSNELPEIMENGVAFSLDILGGHKTGFYLDQRVNRKKLRMYAKDTTVLDCFSYTGGFTLNALSGGAKHVTAVDVSVEALDVLQKNVAANGFAPDLVTCINQDVFVQLRKFRDQGDSFDLIILDPPKFAPTRKQVERAARGYKDINLLAMKLLRPGGVLFTFSCSGGVDRDLFQKIIAGAAEDAGIDIQIVEYLSQASDHPVLLNFPEGAYLKGLILRRM